ncbi:hypothetical protein F4861DRAFT_134569 [Xylaria intraflava]|nr:hypothetical protein F4861DRAFT_134569 [Xylaria intraflava]
MHSTVRRDVTALFISWYRRLNLETGVVADTLHLIKMPIFGFERHENRKKLSSAMKEPFQRDDDETSRLIRAYFNQEEFPLHCRRTLDQFTYNMLKDTEERDNTQVVFKWVKREKARKDRSTKDKPRKNMPRMDRFRRDRSNQRRNLQPSSSQCSDEGSYPLLMVDQLWLWVLEDEETVITSIPNTWDSAEKYNLIRYLMRHELKKNGSRPLIESSMDLTNLIIRCSVDFLHRPGPLGFTMYGCFQSSITVIAEKQTRQFNKFKSQVRGLNKDGIDQQTRATLTNSPFRLNTETRLLADIMDIEDELKTIRQVFIMQKDVIKALVQRLSNNQRKDKADDKNDIIDTPVSPQLPSPHGEPKPPRSALHQDEGNSRTRRVQFSNEAVPRLKLKALNQARDNLRLVESNIDAINEMAAYAQKIRVEINGLLSHKQKQANAWEARFAREGSEHTQRQSKITLVFTLVTVLFLPLSFISSLFAIQVDSFPHNAQTGEINWPLGKAFGLLFGISFGVILVIAFIGFYINRISSFTKHYGRDPLPLRLSKHRYDSDSDSDCSTTSAGSSSIQDSDVYPMGETGTSSTGSSSSFDWKYTLHPAQLLPNIFRDVLRPIAKLVPGWLKEKEQIEKLTKTVIARIPMVIEEAIIISPRNIP